jgi:hypothetical protein
MWSEISFDPRAVEGPVAGELLEALRDARELGGAFLARFFVPEHPTFDYVASRNWLGKEKGFSETFFSSAALVSSVPELKDFGSYEGGEDLQFPPELEWGSSFTLDGEVADSIFSGGAYGRYPGTPAQAKDLGSRFCDEVFGDRFDEVQAYRSWDRWHEWFHYVEGVTWLWIDKRHREIWVLCVTDSD